MNKVARRPPLGLQTRAGGPSQDTPGPLFDRLPRGGLCPLTLPEEPSRTQTTWWSRTVEPHPRHHSFLPPGSVSDAVPRGLFPERIAYTEDRPETRPRDAAACSGQPLLALGAAASCFPERHKRGTTFATGCRWWVSPVLATGAPGPHLLSGMWGAPALCRSDPRQAFFSWSNSSPSPRYSGCGEGESFLEHGGLTSSALRTPGTGGGSRPGCSFTRHPSPPMAQARHASMANFPYLLGTAGSRNLARGGLTSFALPRAFFPNPPDD
jgi:hypothetical protein